MDEKKLNGDVQSERFVLIKEADYPFCCLIVLLFIVDYLIFDHPFLAMWFGFAIAGFSAIANDSIQTLGTFIASNRQLPWWGLQLFIGGILIITLSMGWKLNHGDVAFGRLFSIPQPQQFGFLELATPIFLLVMTRLKMPVSTTFLLLSVFSSRLVIKKMIIKSLAGYVIAFFSGFLLWAILALYFQKYIQEDDYNQRFWAVIQFITTAFLWSLWIMHDMANIVVFLPRQMPLETFLMAIIYLFLVTGFIMYARGGRIQQIVNEKTYVSDIRAATAIDFLYALLLIVFKEWSKVPMSTTWVFLGLLAGREFAFYRYFNSGKNINEVSMLISKDLFRAGAGLLLSLLISMIV